MADDASALSLLIDQFGRPIPRELTQRQQMRMLADEISPAGAMYARPPFSGHLAFGMDPAQLGALVRASDEGSTLGFMTLAEEVEELYPHYAAVLGTRKRAVCQLPITVDAAGDSPSEQLHAEYVRDWLSTGVLQGALFNICDAMGKGYSVCEIIWETGPRGFRPAALKWRTPRWFEVSWSDGETIWLRTEEGFADLVPHKFLVHHHPYKSGLVQRGGLTRAVVFLWLYSAYTQRDWQLFGQGYGLPLRLGRYGPEASDDDKKVLWRAVSSIAGDVAAIVPKSMEVEFVEAKAQGQHRSVREAGRLARPRGEQAGAGWHGRHRRHRRRPRGGQGTSREGRRRRAVRCRAHRHQRVAPGGAAHDLLHLRRTAALSHHQDRPAG